MRSLHVEELMVSHGSCRDRRVHAVAGLMVLMSSLSSTASTEWALDAFIVRDSKGVRCIVEPTERDALSVTILLPGPPTIDALALLPEAERDFTSLPARIVLRTTVQASGSAPLERLPISMDGAYQYPVIDGALSSEPFVQATFPRSWLSPGTAIVAEKSRKGPDGRRVSTQSVCRISEGDAAQWR